MNDIGNLQAQIVALRLAVEGLWLSTLRQDADAIAQAQRLGRENVEAIGQLDASTPDATAMRDAIAHFTEQLWGSIHWQLDQDAKSEPDAV